MLPEKIKQELSEFTTGYYYLAHQINRENFNLFGNCTDYQHFICERLNNLRSYFRCVNPDKPPPVLSEVVRCVWIANHYLYSYSLACNISKWTNPRFLVELKEKYPNYKYPEALADINKAGEYLHYAEHLLYSDKDRYKKIHAAVQRITKNISISIWSITGILNLVDSAVHNPKIKTFKELMQFISEDTAISKNTSAHATRLKSLEHYGNEASTKDEIELWNAFKHDRKFMYEMAACYEVFKNGISEKTE